MLILRTCASLLTAVVLIGAVLAGIRFASDHQSPAWLAKLHGFMAAAAVTLLVFAWATVGLPTIASLALGLLLAAAGGGVFLNLNYRRRKLALPEWLVFAHLSIATAGFVLLLAAALTTRS